MFCPLHTIDQLQAAAGRAASSFSTHSAWKRERDDLYGESGVAVAATLARIATGNEPDDSSDYVYRSSLNACRAYLKKLHRRPVLNGTKYGVYAVGLGLDDTDDGAHLFVSRELRPEQARKFRETVEELLACCRDETDRRIVELQASSEGDPLTLEDIGNIVGIDKSTVARRYAKIGQTYSERNY